MAANNVSSNGNAKGFFEAKPTVNSPTILQRLRFLISEMGWTSPALLGDGRELHDDPKTSGIIEDLKSQGSRIPENLDLLMDIIAGFSRGGLIDDREYTIEKIIQLTASLPATSKNQEKLTGQLIKGLWNILNHPPMNYLGRLGPVPTAPQGSNTDFRFRSADGSYNNPYFPSIGMAGTPYAKSVTPKTILPAVLPDPGLLFDTLFARGDKIIEHPTKTSSMLFNFALIIIHDVFQTDPTDSNKSNTSSYLDLAPLYGNSIGDQTAVRTMKDGMLKPDAFHEARILGFPPGVGAFLICFNRFHNYVAGQLALINEAGRFTKPDTLPETASGKEQNEYRERLAKYDEELFQTARLVTCGLYINIVLNDYVKNILNFNRTESSWTLDPRGDYGQVYDQAKMIPSGVGNAVSVEFNLIYRWHACISERDVKWTEDFMRDSVKISDPATISVEELQKKLKAWGHSIPKDPAERTFGGFKRQPNGMFADKDLIDELAKSTEDIAGSFGPKNIPSVMRAIEIMGITQARKWKVATLNEFRQFCQLKPHETFEDINPDPEIAQTLRNMYDHPNLVEMYPGLMVEDAKKPMAPGSGLCPGFTISKAILADAVSLARGDRFCTTDYSPSNLTAWGYTEVSSDPEIVQGRVLYKLFHNAFPGWYRPNSVYAMYPFTIPSETKIILEGFGTAQNYNFDHPSFVAAPTPILTYNAVKDILADNKRFTPAWGPHIRTMTGQDYMLSGDSPANRQQREEIGKCLYSPPNGVAEIGKFYETVTLKLLKQKSYSTGKGYRVDFVRDIGNLVHVHYVAALFDIPLKTVENPHGIFTEQELYNILAPLFAWVFVDVDPSNSFKLEKDTRKAAAKLSASVEAICRAVKIGGPLNHLRHDHNDQLKSYGRHMIERVLEGKTVSEAVGAIVPTIAASCAVQAQAFAQLLELFFSPAYIHHWPAIQSLARDRSDPAASFQKLRKYVYEATRISPGSFGLLRIVVADSVSIQDGPSRRANLKKGDPLFVDFITASMDPEVFPKPELIDLERPESSYLQFGYGPHECLGKQLTLMAMTSILKVVAGNLEGLTVEGDWKLKGKTLPGGIREFLTEDWARWNAFPTTMKIRFDSFVE